MTIFILLGLFIAFPGIRSLIGGETFFVENRLLVFTIFAFSGLFPVCVYIVRNHQRFFTWLLKKIQRTPKPTKRELELLAQYQQLKKELDMTKEELRKEKAWKEIPIAGKL